MSKLNIAMAQINALVGDIVGNTEKVIATVKNAQERLCADVIVFPELTLTGYPPEDLLLRPSLDDRIDAALNSICDANLSVYTVIGYPKRVEGKLYNVAGVVFEGQVVCEYIKQCLPNYQVFDEKRYFSEGSTASSFSVNGIKIGLTVCEDIWDGSPITQSKTAGVDLLLNISASPFHLNKQQYRERLVRDRAQEVSLPIVFVNWVGGQDELVFDGGSVAFNPDGELVVRCPMFEESLVVAQYDHSSRKLSSVSLGAVCELGDELSIAYRALVLGVRDYVNKNRFKGVVLGLSGGIDSALTLAIACDAIGPERVEAVMMPFRYTSDMSINDAKEEADLLGVKYRSIGIEPMYSAFTASLEEAFENTQKDKTEENLQARTRGVLLMALSNKLGYLVLTTGNKSEMAVGYATLYGDMAGGLDVLKDVPKTMVFKLARYRNTIEYVIPESVITRPPSAELAPDQKDEDSLPAYDILDQILELYIEKDCSYDQIVEQGFDAEDVRQVIRLVDLNEYKRRQAPIGIRMSERAFGRDRRYPITNGWHIGS
ncbi:NAD+ synthase [Agarilytica rhodophyticola]|uniref:NAD+ synthase n=1 Tax=Agarilytica rhodophyticola TaxID=1737490 RepID=UPI000B3429D1|nr:NAD+ synthase [Agarilytica rhodophyticola]